MSNQSLEGCGGSKSIRGYTLVIPTVLQLREFLQNDDEIHVFPTKNLINVLRDCRLAEHIKGFVGQSSYEHH